MHKKYHIRNFDVKTKEIIGEGCLRFASTWWKYLKKVEGRGGVKWFTTGMVRKVGDGTSFLNESWSLGAPLQEKFPRFFVISYQKNSRVRELWSRRDEGQRRHLTWRGELFVWETELLQNLMRCLDSFALGEGRDVWGW